MILYFHPGDWGITLTQLLVGCLLLLIIVVPFIGFVIWMAAQVIAGFKKDARRKLGGQQAVDKFKNPVL